MKKREDGIGGTGITKAGALHSDAHSHNTEKDAKIKRSLVSLPTLLKLGFTAAFLFWIYIIWSGAADLDQQVQSMSDRSLAIHKLQVEYKLEVQEWKNVLLRSNNAQLLDENWQIFETKHQNVARKAQEIIKQYDERRIVDPIKTFASAHSANFIQYQSSKEILINSGFDEVRADAAVMGLDRPLVGYLEEAAQAIREEQQRINDQVAAQTRNQINQSLLILAFVGLLVVWMPK